MNEKVVLVTGGAKGIGASLVRIFAANNYNVILHYNKSVLEAESLKKKLESYNVKIELIKADLCNELDIKKMYEKTVEKYKTIDLLINNAALAHDNLIEDKTKEEFMKVLETNVVGPFLMIKYFKDITKQIINISSTDASDTYNEYSIDYCASKAALNSLTQTASLACQNTKIISIMLPWVNTEAIREMNPDFLKNELRRTKQERLFEPNEISKKIYEISNSNIKTGTIIRWSDVND